MEQAHWGHCPVSLESAILSPSRKNPEGRRQEAHLDMSSIHLLGYSSHGHVSTFSRFLEPSLRAAENMWLDQIPQLR